MEEHDEERPLLLQSREEEDGVRSQPGLLQHQRPQLVVDESALVQASRPGHLIGLDICQPSTGHNHKQCSQLGPIKKKRSTRPGQDLIK